MAKRKLEGSLINRLMTDDKFKKPEVGMFVTEFMWSDRRVWYCTAVSKTGKECTLQRVASKLIGDYYRQNYSYTNDDGTPRLEDYIINIKYRWGKWRHTDSNTSIDLGFGVCDEYEDPSF